MSDEALTPQQGRVAALVARGRTDKQIAAALGIEIDTVAFHVRRIVVAWGLDASSNRRVQITRRFYGIKDDAA